MPVNRHRDDVDTLIEGVVRGDRLSAARIMRLVDDRAEGSEKALESLYAHTGRAHVIGLAGSPGCGKSTLVDGLIEHYRKQDRIVGVVAVDPSSSITGGAILGDRIRMQRHAADRGVFIRSLATRGALGGLSSSAQDIGRIMDAMGCDLVLVETVGVGQDEVEIASVAHTVAVVLSPDTGDAVQIMKAGILEVADLFVINKADRQGADMVAKELKLFFQMHGTGDPPAIVETVATKQLGIEDLGRALDEHRGKTDADRSRRRLRSELTRRLAERVVTMLTHELEPSLEAALDAIETGTLTPYSTVRNLFDEFSRRHS